MTATEHVVEVETPPLAVQPAEVGPNRCASVPATHEQQRHEVVYEKSDGVCTSSQKVTILSHRKASAEPDGIFRQKPLEDYVTKKSICEVVATSMVSFRVV
jgi:hypothetical protein